jgi:hypothetical protein
MGSTTAFYMMLAIGTTTLYWLDAAVGEPDMATTTPMDE